MAGPTRYNFFGLVINTLTLPDTILVEEFGVIEDFLQCHEEEEEEKLLTPLAPTTPGRAAGGVDKAAGASMDEKSLNDDEKEECKGEEKIPDDKDAGEKDGAGSGWMYTDGVADEEAVDGQSGDDNEDYYFDIEEKFMRRRRRWLRQRQVK